jgi:hypothetical protein
MKQRVSTDEAFRIDDNRYAQISDDKFHISDWQKFDISKLRFEIPRVARTRLIKGQKT